VSLLEVENLSVRFPGRDGEVDVLSGVSLAVGAGEALGIVGESGCGKSLTALAIMGLLPPSARAAGRVDFAQQPLLGLPESGRRSLRGDRMAMVFQDPMSALNPHLRIGTQMAEVLQQHRGQSRAAALAESARLLDAVQLSAAAQRLRQYPHELSGGQRQRVLIAMALLCRPQLLIADEPTTALDVTVQAQLLRLLSALRREFGLALLLISHDLGVIAELCERTLVMYAGRVVEQADTAELLRRPRHPYTEGLLASRPQRSAHGAEPLRAIPGQPPRPGQAGRGCPFEPRCARRQSVCAEQDPALLSTQGRSLACHFPADSG